MKVKYISDPEVITGQLRQLNIFRRQRRERGIANTSTRDLIQEAEITISLLETQRRIALNLLGEQVKRSIERR